VALGKEAFIHIIDATPLVSIDLIVRNARGEVLLGRRRSRPAQDYWFVPGGRIRKNERSQDALVRIAQTELGVAVKSGRLLGVFDHLYDDNFFGIPDIGTHYVVIAWECELPNDSRLMPDEQHAELRWWDVASLLASDDVHVHTKWYFQTESSGFRCAC
jgi:colanic acid biosynthesis protein WcaH